MKKVENHTVNTIIVRNSYIPNSEIITNDQDGDCITFGEKQTQEFVKEVVILYNPKLDLKEVHRLLKKTIDKIEAKINSENTKVLEPQLESIEL